MPRRWLALLPCASLVSLVGFAACGGTASHSAPEDAGGVPTEASVPDGGGPADARADADSAPVDSGSPEVGPLDAPAEAAPGDALATGVDELLGITTDGQVIYAQGQKVMAVSLKGGAPELIGPMTSPSAPRVESFGVIFEGSSDAGGGVDTTLWTKAHGAHDLGAVSYATVSPDGTLVAAAGGNPGKISAASLVLANSDGTNEHTLVPTVDWVGAWFGSNGTLLLPLGNPADGLTDGLYWLTPGGFSSQIPFGSRLITDPTGSYVFQEQKGGPAVLVKTADATSSPVDTNIDETVSVVFDAKGQYVYYEKGGVLMRASVATPSSPAALGTPPCPGAVTLSPGGTLLYCSDGTTGHIAPAATGKFAAVTGVSLTPQAPAEFTLDDGFFWYHVPSTDDWLAQPVGGGTPVPLASQLGSVLSDLRGSLLLVVDGGLLEIVDASGATPPHPLASSVINYEISPDAQWAVYLTEPNGPNTPFDLHVVALP